MSSPAISAVIDAAGRSSIRVMLPWTSTCSTVGDRPERDDRDRPDRQRLERVDRVDRRRIELDDDLDRLAVGGLDAGRRLRDERRADLAGDLGGRQADGDRLVRVDRDLDLGRGLDQVALEVEEVGLVAERREDRRRRLVDVGGGLARDDDVEAVRR